MNTLWSSGIEVAKPPTDGSGGTWKCIPIAGELQETVDPPLGIAGRMREGETYPPM